MTLLLLLLAVVAVGPLRAGLSMASRALGQRYPAIAAIEVLFLHRR